MSKIASEDEDRPIRRPSMTMDSGFEPNAILRGAQLTLVGANRVLQNPGLFTSDHYRQAAIAVGAGIIITLLVSIPTVAVRTIIWFSGFVINLKDVTWDDKLIHGMEFLQHSVLQIPFFLMTLMRYITPTLDNVFMESLDWVDRTYFKMHKSDNPQGLRATYYPNLKMYTHQSPSSGTPTRKSLIDAFTAIFTRFSKRAGISLAVYLLSFLPVVGRLVLPAASFYTFNKAVGLPPAVAIFATSIFLPKQYLIMFLQTYFASRTLMRELLVPYFARIKFTPDQKKRWFKDREGVLFGFAFTFTVFLKIPLIGVLIYGIAEASCAYLITKITDPPPPPATSQGFAASQVHWKNKHEFMSLPLVAIDALNVKKEKEATPKFVKEYPTQKFS